MSEIEKTYQVILFGIVLDSMRGQFYFFGLKLDWNIYPTSSHMEKSLPLQKHCFLTASAVRNLLDFKLGLLLWSVKAHLMFVF